MILTLNPQSNMFNFNANNDLIIAQSLLAFSSSRQPNVLPAAAMPVAATMPTAPSESKSRDTHGPQREMTRLYDSFTPGYFDVICARGGQAKMHVGNHNFRHKVAQHAQDYATASTKVAKSSIVTAIVEWVRRQSPFGGFVKRIDGVWYKVGDDIAREKVGQALREMNHGKYKSSMKAKRRRWRKERLEQHDVREEDAALRTMLKNHNEVVEARLETLGKKGPDDDVLDLFTQQNSSLLESVKSDEKLQEHIGKLV